MIDKVFWGSIIVFFCIAIVLVIQGIHDLDEYISNCKGLVVKTPDGWICSTAQKVN